jgi:flagellin-like hook-associated protein FlgL
MIKQAYDNIREIHARINVCLGTVGARHLQTENAGFNLGDMNQALQSIQNTYEAPDYPWVITQFVAEQSSQDAIFSTISRMGRNSLFDYIG